MSLRVKQRIFALTDTYDVCDHNGVPRYSVSTEFLTIGHKIHVVDCASGCEVGRIEERVFTFLHKADIYAMGTAFSVTREFTFFKPKYTLGNGWHIEGDFLGWDYTVYDNLGRHIADVSKEPLHFSDVYNLSVNDPRDELIALLAAITIDMMNCSN